MREDSIARVEIDGDGKLCVTPATKDSLPLMVYRTRNGARTVASDHPLYRILHDSPNADQTALDFWEFVCASLELHGNAYAEVVRARNGRIIALGVPITPELVTVRRLDTGALEYEWVDQGRRIIAGQERVLHIRGFGGNPLGGLSTLSAGRQSFGLAQAIERASGDTFRNGVRPSGLLKTADTLTIDPSRTLHTRTRTRARALRPDTRTRARLWQKCSAIEKEPRGAHNPSTARARKEGEIGSDFTRYVTLIAHIIRTRTNRTIYVIDFIGEPTGARTRDLLIKSRERVTGAAC